MFDLKHHLIMSTTRQVSQEVKGPPGRRRRKKHLKRSASMKWRPRVRGFYRSMSGRGTVQWRRGQCNRVLADLASGRKCGRRGDPQSGLRTSEICSGFNEIDRESLDLFRL